MTRDKLLEIFNYNKEQGKIFYIKGIGSSRKGGEAGYRRPDGYVSISINKKKYLLHRLIWIIETGKEPVDEIDHINHDRADNRFINLREVNKKTNSQNLSKHKGNKSGVMGVWYSKRDNIWMARISVNKESIYLGSFRNIDDATKARKDAEHKYGFHKNHGNNKVTITEIKE